MYLGTGAAEGFPAIFCNCPNCNAARERGIDEFRTRAQVLIDDTLSIDFPPEAYAHALRFGVDLSSLCYLLVTHSHMDHFYAHDFILRGYKYATVLGSPILSLYGNKEVLNVFTECTARELKPSVTPNLCLNELKPYAEYRVGEYRVLTLLARHCKTEEALLFYIEREGKGYLHLHDTGLLYPEAYRFLSEHGAKVNLVTFDCTFVQNEGGEEARHMGLPDNVKVREELERAKICDSQTKYVITHFSHNANPLRANLAPLEKKYGVIAAYDGFTIEI
jgi:phosphoribosyl 1,2-cyclic phosphate phosphodiesterase